MEREREAGSTHIARCLSGLLSDSAVAPEKASSALAVALHCAEQRSGGREGAYSIDRALGDRIRDASYSN